MKAVRDTLQSTSVAELVKRARSQAYAQRLTPAQDPVLEAYARGVNAGLESLGARPFEYFLTNAAPKPWQKADSILAVYTMYMELNDERAIRDVQRGLARQVLPEAVFAWLYPEGTNWDAPLSGDAREASPYPGPDVYSLAGVATASVTLAQFAGGEPVVPGIAYADHQLLPARARQLTRFCVAEKDHDLVTGATLRAP